jgi:hypothetical protein
MLLAERRGDAEMAKLAVRQIEAAFTTSRGGDAPHRFYRPVPRQPRSRPAGGLSRRHHRPLPALRHVHSNALWERVQYFFSCFESKID